MINSTFFQNVISITKFEFEEWEEVILNVNDVIELKINDHNPNYVEEDKEEKRRKDLSPQMQQIEDILDEKNQAWTSRRWRRFSLP